jgi:5'-methylthioadenosine phosphorylase
VTANAELAVIGGTGFYSLFEDAEELLVDTPYGKPSSAICLGVIGDRSVAFLARHGRGHSFLPHEINYRANLWALRAVGVRQILAPCAVGSLRPELSPGTVAVPEQLVDRTTGRAQTYFSGQVAHVPFADPYCPIGRATVCETATGRGFPVVNGGTMVVIEGPRFSTRAESQWYARQGWDLVNMTGHPEAVLARELGLCYTAIALVTDLDAGVTAEDAVNQRSVFEELRKHIERLRRLLCAAIPALPAIRTCPCTQALDGITPLPELAEPLRQ